MAVKTSGQNVIRARRGESRAYDPEGKFDYVGIGTPQP